MRRQHKTVDPTRLEWRGQFTARAELVDRRAPFVVVTDVDNDETAGAHAVVEEPERDGDLVAREPPDPHQRELFDGRFRKRRVERTLEEVDPVVEETEPCESVAHEIQVGSERRHATLREYRSLERLGRRAESVGHPDRAVGELPRIEVSPQEDRSAATARAALGEVAGDRLRAHDVQAAFEMVERTAAHRGVRQEGPRGGVVGTVGARTLAHELAERPLVVACGIAQLLRRERPAGDDVVGEVLQPELVIEVVLVEQRALQEVEVTVHRALDLFGPLVVDVVLEDHRPQPHLLRDLEERVATFGTLKPRQRGRQLRLAREPLLLDDDGETEVDRYHEPAQRSVVLGDEVVERGHHAVARAAFDLRVVHCGVQAPACAEPLLSGLHPGRRIGLAELVGNVVGFVVQVAPPVGPQHVVHHQNR